jgi:hypothetical protein
MIRSLRDTQGAAEATQIPAQRNPQPFKPLGRPILRGAHGRQSQAAGIAVRIEAGVVQMEGGPELAG